MTTVDGALLDALLPRRAPATTAGLAHLPGHAPPRSRSRAADRDRHRHPRS